MNINKINIYASFTLFTITKLNINIGRKWRKCEKNDCNVLTHFLLKSFYAQIHIYAIGFCMILSVRSIMLFIYAIYSIYALTYTQNSALKKLAL